MSFSLSGIHITARLDLRTLIVRIMHASKRRGGSSVGTAVKVLLRAGFSGYLLSQAIVRLNPKATTLEYVVTNENHMLSRLLKVFSTLSISLPPRYSRSSSHSEPGIRRFQAASLTILSPITCVVGLPFLFQSALQNQSLVHRPEADNAEAASLRLRLLSITTTTGVAGRRVLLLMKFQFRFSVFMVDFQAPSVIFERVTGSCRLGPLLSLF
ncbi:hypothetical protein QBC46DRAFT_398504, partial [Diplogelasinospora grovesii]